MKDDIYYITYDMMDHKNTLRMLGTHLWKKKREKRKFNTIYSSKTYDTKKKHI